MKSVPRFLFNSVFVVGWLFVCFVCMLIVCVALDAGLLAGWLIIANIRDVFNHLFSLGVQHFHEESLCGCTSSTMLQIKVIFSAGSHYMNFRNNTYQFCEFFLYSYKLSRQATHNSNRVEESKEKEKERKKMEKQFNLPVGNT